GAHCGGGRGRSDAGLEDRGRGAEDFADRDGGAGDHCGAPGTVRRSWGRRLSAGDAGWEHFETEADVGVHAWAPTRAAAVAEAAPGVFALSVRPDVVQERGQREVPAQARST